MVAVGFQGAGEEIEGRLWSVLRKSKPHGWKLGSLDAEFSFLGTRRGLSVRGFEFRC